MRAERHTGTLAVEIPGFALQDVLHESGPRIVYRAVREATGTEVVLKTLRDPYPRKRDLAEIRREYQLADRLNIEGVIRVHSLVSYGAGNLAIETELFGLSLADFMSQRKRQPLPVDRFFPIAIRLAQILGRLHEHGVVHKDVGPRNVLIEPNSGELRLIDFGICSELSRERQSVVLSQRIEGSLPYISPEQTGRMNRDLDYRSDYYSLGVTCFELLTGALPFAATSALEWVHCHISQTAPSACEVNRDVPQSLSRIVAKLMAKNPEDRYQSTHGLIADLERCRDELVHTGSNAVFELGQADVSRRFQVPQQLYGRDAELAQLETLFDDVSHGAVGVCLVSGHPGVGKSALVNALSRSVIRKRGHLVHGKFDQFHRNVAYSTFAQAFRGLVEQLLGEPRQSLDRMREALLQALGSNGQLLVDLIPELELIIGEQPPVLELGPEEAQNRFQLVFLSFVRVFANAQTPLVIFIDDLQWSDVPTLNLIQRLATVRDQSNLLLIGAYRSDGVKKGHPLQVILHQIKKAREVIELKLQPLEQAAVERLTADTLHADPARCRILANFIFQTTQGNPFFINELLRSLYEQGAICFDPEAGRWAWDMDAISRAEVGGNVIDFVVAGLRRLSEATQQVLQLAACIGNSFDLKTLSIIHERSMAQTSAELQEALQRNMLVPLSESYKFIGLDVSETGSGDGAEVANPTYRFHHDRIQQAAYALIDADRKQAVHLSVGRLMQQHSTPQETEQRLIDIVGHLNAGRALIDDPNERGQLVQLNLRAGTKARQSSAYDSALALLRVGYEMLPADAWETDYELVLALCRELQQCAYLTGDHDAADAWMELMLERVHSPLTKAEILSARTRQYATTGKMRESIQAAFAGLDLLGVKLSEAPDATAVDAEMAVMEQGLAGRDIARLIDAPALTDPQARVAIQLLMEIFPAAFLSGGGNLLTYLVVKSVNISLRHGNSPESAFAYAAYGMLLCGSLNNPALGQQYGRLAVEMNERFGDIALKSRIIYVYAMFIHHWGNHWSSMTPWFLEGIEAGYQSGDMLYLAYSAQDCIIWDPRLDLETATQEQRKYLAIVRDCEYRDSLDSGTLFLQMQLNFQGLTDGLYSMNDTAFDEVACVQGMQQRQFMTGIANYHIYKAEIHSFYEDYDGALEHVEAEDRLIASSMSLPQLVRFYIVAFLTRAALYPDMPDDNQRETLARLESDMRQMAFWAGSCPENFEHLRLIMAGELARLTGRMPEALAFYERAIASAKTSGFRRDEAMANELAGRYLFATGLTKAAEGYLRAARYLYDTWGASRKVEQLEKRYPRLFTASGSVRRQAGTLRTTQTATLNSAVLDMSSVIKVSQAISGEIVLDKLWRTTMQILLENAGGQRGFLVVEENDQMMIRAQAEAGGESIVHAQPKPVTVPGTMPSLPVSIVNRVLRTGKPLVLDDATKSARFATDPYIVAKQPKSIICVPLLRHKKFGGAIYLENNLTVGAFSQERVEVMKLLSAQASISIENAKLYEAQARLIEAQQRFVPREFLENLGYDDIARVRLGEYISREMSVLFADLRDFTSLAERIGPRAVVELLNRYFSCLSPQIAEAGGFIDSFNGDEIMALFGLPADRAVRAGVQMWRALDEFNRNSRASGHPALKMGIGVNSGPLVLGTVGGHDRLECSVVGDTVNLASRIEQLTKFYKARFLIGESTFERLGAPGEFSIRLIDRVAVKGKLQAASLYEVLDAERPERRQAKESTRELLGEAMACYCGRDFAAARRIINEALKLDPQDTVLAIFAGRCERYLETPPPPDWQGFETLVHN